MNVNVIEKIVYIFIWQVWIDFECEMSKNDWLIIFSFSLMVVLEVGIMNVCSLFHGLRVDWLIYMYMGKWSVTIKKMESWMWLGYLRQFDEPWSRINFESM